MSKCMLCKNYADCYEVDDDLCDFKFSEKALTNYEAKIRAEAIDELTKALCEYNLGIKMYTLEELNGIWADIREIAEKVKEQV